MSRDFVGALLQLNAEKQVPKEQLIRTIEEAIEAAWRRTDGVEDIHVQIDSDTGKIRAYRARTVVEEIEDPLTELTLEEAKVHKASANVGDLVEIEELDPSHFGRIHAQTAKQVVLQRLREAERDVVFDQFASREGEMITGQVNRVEPRAIILDVGKGVEAILATTEQSPVEHYRIGQNVKAFVLEVRRSTKGPQIFVSRRDKGFLRRLFELEVPEIHAGTVEIKAIAREPGSRSKVAVASRQEGLDPVGATVGQRGARVQSVVAELGGEKIDVIPWSDDPAVFVANALSPAQVLGVDIDEEHRIASITVPERMLSLAIGREGQNARLAAKLTGWRIDIRSDVSVAEAKAARASAPSEAAVAGNGAAAGETSAASASEAVVVPGTAAPALPAGSAPDTEAVATAAPAKPRARAAAKEVKEPAPAQGPKPTKATTAEKGSTSVKPPKATPAAKAAPAAKATTAKATTAKATTAKTAPAAKATTAKATTAKAASAAKATTAKIKPAAKAAPAAKPTTAKTATAAKTATTAKAKPAAEAAPAAKATTAKTATAAKTATTAKAKPAAKAEAVAAAAPKPRARAGKVDGEVAS